MNGFVRLLMLLGVVGIVVYWWRRPGIRSRFWARVGLIVSIAGYLAATTLVIVGASTGAIRVGDLPFLLLFLVCIVAANIGHCRKALPWFGPSTFRRGKR